MLTSALFITKNFEIYGVSARTREGGGQFFAILCGRLLWTAPNSACYNFVVLCF